MSFFPDLPLVLTKPWSNSPLRLSTAVGAVLAAASISLQSNFHRRVQFGVGGLFVQLSGSWAVGIHLRQWRVAPLGACAASAPGRARTVSLRSPPRTLGLGASPHGLKLGQGHDVCSLGSMPDCTASCCVVVVEAAALLVKQLPPLVAVCLADGNAWWRFPAALASGQIHIHVLSGAWLQDLHPIRAGRGREKKHKARLEMAAACFGAGRHGGLEDAAFNPPSPSSKQLTLFDRLRHPKEPISPYGDSVNATVP